MLAYRLCIDVYDIIDIWCAFHLRLKPYTGNEAMLSA